MADKRTGGNDHDAYQHVIMLRLEDQEDHGGQPDDKEPVLQLTGSDLVKVTGS